MSRMLDEVRAQAERKEGTEEVAKKRKLLISVGAVLVVVLVVVALIISRSEWIQTDHDMYLLGQPVTVRFANPTFRTVGRGFWGIEGVQHRQGDMWGIGPMMGPGQTFTWTWDQAVVDDPPASSTRVPPGIYTAYWQPVDPKTGEPIGRFTYEFEIVEGTVEGQH